MTRYSGVNSLLCVVVGITTGISTVAADGLRFGIQDPAGFRQLRLSSLGGSEVWLSRRPALLASQADRRQVTDARAFLVARTSASSNTCGVRHEKRHRGQD